MDRRSFLKKSALAGMGWLILKDSRSARGYPANEKLNIAIIGAGGQGAGNTNAVSSENIVALCDVDWKYAAGTFNRFPNAKKYWDFRKMFDEMDKEIDAVVVSTPDHTHAVASVMAMKLGKHVFCEKPLTRTVYEARVMREIAKKQKLVTQMGNQGTASEGLRRAVELVWAGVIGDVTEVHVSFGGGNNPVDRPSDTPSIPKDLQWDLWLGPAPYRPYHPTYHPGGWRNWRDFGTGVLGDFGCHSMNVVFMALKLDLLWKPEGKAKEPITVEAEASEVHRESYSRWVIVRYTFPAREKMPPVKVTWYNGGPRPPKELFLGYQVMDGALLVGTKGTLFSNCPWNTRFVLLPQKQFEGFQGPPQSLPRSPGHHAEWLRACKGGPMPLSNFDYAGPLTEMVLLGNVALQVGHKIEYDPIKGRIVNCQEANKFLHRNYREGWTL